MSRTHRRGIPLAFGSLNVGSVGIVAVLGLLARTAASLSFRHPSKVANKFIHAMKSTCERRERGSSYTSGSCSSSSITTTTEVSSMCRVCVAFTDYPTVTCCARLHVPVSIVLRRSTFSTVMTVLYEKRRVKENRRGCGQSGAANMLHKSKQKTGQATVLSIPLGSVLFYSGTCG